MKNFALMCFLFVASACVFVARADEETPAVDAPKMEDQSETADVMANADETEADEAGEENDESKAGSDEEETLVQEDKESEEDEEDTTDLADDEPEKRGWACRRYRKGRYWCKACGCRRVCKPTWCYRPVCRRYRCTKKVCHYRIRYRIVRYKYRNPYYPRYSHPYFWKTKRVGYRFPVCKYVRTFCNRCYKRHRYYCHRCTNVCKYRKCPYYG